MSFCAADLFAKKKSDHATAAASATGAPPVGVAPRVCPVCCVVIFVLEGLVGTLRCLVCSIQLTFSQKTERHVVPPGLHYTT